MFPGEGSGCGLRLSPSQAEAPEAPRCPVWLLPTQSVLFLPEPVGVVLCLPWPFSCAHQASSVCHQGLLTLSIL